MMVVELEKLHEAISRNGDISVSMYGGADAALVLDVDFKVDYSHWSDEGIELANEDDSISITIDTEKIKDVWIEDRIETKMYAIEMTTGGIIYIECYS